ncbi:unannotated protein [freshwater metagenome]|uniref:Unannotated protein n=1 Tax=freshwater metagenome TaxID=449393 RepID=A0A6J6GCK2_9ZZZZ|nr:helix-hairpin-helix domain-containing protein [Actinomycetota bacterium]MSZ24082.1 helix-hairpin-helix domain-containing protein [Actinomycetota bacterium]MSZ92889.1 helix-hairpin-helix domain-containing protein [Actinomycetota bacterium]
MVDDKSTQPHSDVAARALDHLRHDANTKPDASQTRQQMMKWLRRQLASVSIRVGVCVAAVVLFALLCAVLIVGRSTSLDGQAIPSVSSVTPGLVTTTTVPGVVIDVGGAVRQPGVHRLPIGSRVVDALEAAGGPSEGIDLDHINLAATVSDGQRVWFTKKGELPPVGVAGSVGASAPSAGTGPLDLNSATLEQLDSLNGIGPTTAKAIIDRRNEMGRFRSVDDLLTVKGIGSTKLDSIRSSVVVR